MNRSVPSSFRTVHSMYPSELELKLRFNHGGTGKGCVRQRAMVPSSWKRNDPMRGWGTRARESMVWAMPLKRRCRRDGTPLCVLNEFDSMTPVSGTEVLEDHVRPERPLVSRVMDVLGEQRPAQEMVRGALEPSDDAG